VSPRRGTNGDEKQSIFMSPSSISQHYRLVFKSSAFSSQGRKLDVSLLEEGQREVMITPSKNHIRKH
jgi:hypothetical protein